VRSLEILSKLESAGIDPKQARAILECLELAAAESKRRAHPPAIRSTFSPRGMQSLFHRGQPFSVSAFSSASAISPPSSILGGSAASDLRIDLIELKTSLIGWMFFFAVTQSLATALLIKILLP
jgi:hypothetical protein